MPRPDVETVQPHDDETQRLTTQLLPADAVASSEARLTTRDFCHERLAGPYSPDSYSLHRLLEGATAIKLHTDMSSYVKRCTRTRTYKSKGGRDTSFCSEHTRLHMPFAPAKPMYSETALYVNRCMQRRLRKLKCRVVTYRYSCIK